MAAWQKTFLRSGEEGLKRRREDPLAPKNHKLKAKIGELTGEIELLNEKIEGLESGLQGQLRREGTPP